MASLKYKDPQTGEWHKIQTGGGGASTADKVAVTDETASAFGLENGATVDEVFAAIPEKINSAAKVATGSYVGTGTYGKDNPCTLTFDFTPKFVMVYEPDMGVLTGYYYEWLTEDGSDSSFNNYSNTLIAAYGAMYAQRYSRMHHRYSTDEVVSDYFTWGENTFSWYSGGYSTDATVQLNYGGKTYYYLAIG